MLSCPPEWDISAGPSVRVCGLAGLLRSRGGTAGPLRPPAATGRPRTRPVQTVSAVRRTASTASTTKAANQARIVRYAVAGTDWLLIRSVPIRVIW